MGSVEEEDLKEFKDKLTLNIPTDGDYEMLTMLNISDGQVKELPMYLERLVSLQILIADNNLITTLPSTLCHLVELRKLSVVHNKLSELPELFSKLHFLEILDLSHNKFVSAPSALEAGCADITWLNMAYNFLQEWNKVPLCARALKHLDLSFNCLQSNPSWIWSELCYSLESVNFSYNNFQNFAQPVLLNQLLRSGAFETLVSLNLSNCGFSSNDLTLVYRCSSLKDLNIGNTIELGVVPLKSRKHTNQYRNFLSELPCKHFQSKSTLSKLVLCHLRLAFLPDDICCLESLEIIDCSFNELQWLPESFSKLSNLHIAVFSCNKLICLPEDIGMLKSLKELWLDNNQIEDLPVSMGDLEELHWLDLYSNLLETLPVGVEKLLPNLLGLDLGYNLFCVESQLLFSSKCHYNKIKTAMREHPQLGTDRNVSRSDTLQSKTDDLSSSPSSDELSETSDLYENPLDSRAEENTDEETWDLNDDDEDDLFDPTSAFPHAATSQHSQNSSRKLNGAAFCPADIHAAPSVRAGRNRFQPSDGQFDDA